ncbi:MAG: hypothetical protein IJR82_01155 [Bacilli bacterium]|nr:hypothetical protein [Bacilli bacterium]
MNFKELKEKIEQAKNKKILMLPSSFSINDEIRIVSILYEYMIYCSDIKSINDLYNIINEYHLDVNLFNNPYYLSVSLKSFNETTINIINQLNDETFVEIELCHSTSTNNEILQLLSRISHKRVLFSSNNWINLDILHFVTNNYEFDRESYPLIAIDRIDSTTANKIIDVCKKIDRPSFRIEIKDVISLQNLDTILPYIPEKNIYVSLDDDIFNENNPQNARNMIIQNKKINCPNNKKMKFNIRGITYYNIEYIYDLEKNIGLIKSHIPKNASKLDIITYVTLFMVNYFIYDYDMYRKIIANIEFEDIDLTQFLIKGKGVCKHFAKFTEYVLNSVGIDCKTLESYGEYSDNCFAGHAFNIVTINGQSSYLDTTWIVEKLQNGLISSLSESSDFLTSNEEFGHEDYEDVISEYKCVSYNRQEIEKSVSRVMKWSGNYTICPQALRDLFRKYILKIEKNVYERIEKAVPRRR